MMLCPSEFTLVSAVLQHADWGLQQYNISCRHVCEIFYNRCMMYVRACSMARAMETERRKRILLFGWVCQTSH